MSLIQTITVISSLRNAIEAQVNMLEDFGHENQDLVQLVQAELKGSTRGHDTNMLNSLKQAEDSLKKSLGQLHQAIQSLDRVTLI